MSLYELFQVTKEVHVVDIMLESVMATGVVMVVGIIGVTYIGKKLGWF